MKTFARTVKHHEDDALRLLGLSRIPRCVGCDRLDALRVAHETREPLGRALPLVPRGCNDQVCRPLVTRFSSPFHIAGGGML